jgi:hypothetical protein
VPVVVDEVIAPIALTLLDCLRTEMAKTPTPPGKVELRPGDSVAALISTTEDECCAGLAWVRPDADFPSGQFPAQDEGAHKCGPVQWAVTLEVGAMRCAPVGDAQTLPTAEQWAEAAFTQLDDRAAMRRAICCLQSADSMRGRLVQVGPGLPLPVAGACTGAIYTVTVSAPACDCPQAG